MTKEFSDWTAYDQWLIADYETKETGGKQKVFANYDHFLINCVQEKDGKIVAEMEENPAS